MVSVPSSSLVKLTTFLSNVVFLPLDCQAVCQELRNVDVVRETTTTNGARRKLEEYMSKPDALHLNDMMSICVYSLS